MRITGTTAFVTGANRGIGAALVKALRETGAAKIYAAARQPSDLARMAALGDGRVVPIELDITDRSN